MKPNLTEYEAFVAVVEEANLSGAAKRLNITKSAISKQLSKLESRLGVGLIERTTHALVVTPQGQQFYPQCKEILQSIHSHENNLRNSLDTPEGKLRISFSQVLLQSPLVKTLAKFHQNFPSIVCEMRVEDSVEDLMAAQIDFAFRLSHQENSRLVARPLAEANLVFCASPTYLEQHGKPRVLKSLNKHQVIIPNFDRYNEPKAISELMHAHIDRSKLHSSNNVTALIQAALEGMGIIAVLDIAVKEYLDKGQLVNLFPKQDLLKRTLHLVYPRQSYPVKRLDVFKKYVLEEFPKML
ncbi:MAG: LysR family transcriptional regulator [Bermanella sp.]